MEDIMMSLQALLAQYGLQIIAAILILVIGRWVAIMLKKVIQRLLERSKIEETLVSFIANLAYIAMMAAVVIAALRRVGFDTLRPKTAYLTRVINTPAKIAEVITPEMLAPNACGNTTASGVTSATDFCATLAQVGTQLTPAIPMTGLTFLPVAK